MGKDLTAPVLTGGTFSRSRYGPLAQQSRVHVDTKGMHAENEVDILRREFREQNVRFCSASRYTQYEHRDAAFLRNGGLLPHGVYRR